MSVGVDLVRISRFENKSDHFIKRILGAEEYKEYLSIDDNKKTTYLASRFAFKEAYFKLSGDIRYLSYQLLNDNKGKPYCLEDSSIQVSLSHEDDYLIVIAFKI